MSRLLVFVLLCAAVSPAAAQSAADAPKGEAANRVRLDVQATRDGQPVRDLSANELTVLEDGVAQTLDSLAHISTAAGTRRLIIFFDTLHVAAAGSGGIEESLATLLERTLDPADEVVLFSPGMAAGDLRPESRAAAVARLRDRRPDWGRAGRVSGLDSRRELYESCYPDRGVTAGLAQRMIDRRREQLALDALTDLVARASSLDEGRHVVLVVSDGWPLDAGATSAETRESPGRGAGNGRPGIFRRRDGDGRRGGSGGMPVSVDPQCAADRSRLLEADERQRLRVIGEAANRALVTFYPFHTAAVVDAGADTRARLEEQASADRERQTRQDSLVQLAAETGGRATVTAGGAEDALRRLLDDTASYYLVSYRSSNVRLDGRLRAVTVRALRPGVQVRARRGYRGMTAEQLVASIDSASAAPLTAGGGARTSPPLRIRTASWRTDDGAAVWLAAELDYAMRKNLSWSAGATVEAVLLAGDGREVMTRSLRLSAGEWSVLTRVPDGGGLEPGEYAVRVRIRPDAEPGEPVSAAARVTIVARQPAIGEATIWRRGPSTAQKTLVTADVRFQRSDWIRLELPTSLPGSAAARMLDRTGSLLRVPVTASTRETADGTRWIVAEAALAPLAAGDYAIEVAQGGVTLVTPFQVIP